MHGDGSFTVVVQPRVEYIFLGTCQGYLNHVEELYVDTSSVSNEYVLQFPLASMGSPVLVENVFYAFDSAALDGFAHEAAELFVQHKALNDEATNAMEALLERRIARVEEYALQAAMVRNRRARPS